MEKAFHHKKTSVTFPICLGKRSVHNVSYSVNMAATLNITLWKWKWNGTQDITGHLTEHFIFQLTYRQSLKWRPMIDKMAGKLITSHIASARYQWYLNDSVFWLAQMTLYIMA